MSDVLIICANCGHDLDEHCKIHLIPCCPGKCIGRRDSMKVDYLLGRRVKSVTKTKGRAWTMTFEDDTAILYEDPSIEPPKHLVDQVFQSYTSSSADATLYFGTKDAPNSLKLVLAPLMIGVRGRDKEIVYPYRGPLDAAVLPPDPSDLRAAEGPSDD